jgi:hypothetical protein
MPLHEWAGRTGWAGVHHSWITELLRWIKPRLPAGYRAYIGSAPAVEIGATPAKPDVAVREWRGDEGRRSARRMRRYAAPAPDGEFSVVISAPNWAVYVARLDRLTAAIELVSPRNKDRRDARAVYLNRYMSYLIEGAHLLLVDVHRRPLRFSFADQINRQLKIPQPPLPAPLAVAYRVSEYMDTDFRDVAVWRRPMTPGETLPVMALPLTEEASVPVDLEHTYMRAAADAYRT